MTQMSSMTSSSKVTDFEKRLVAGRRWPLAPRPARSLELNNDRSRYVGLQSTIKLTTPVQKSSILKGHFRRLRGTKFLMMIAALSITTQGVTQGGTYYAVTGTATPWAPSEDGTHPVPLNEQKGLGTVVQPILDKIKENISYSITERVCAANSAVIELFDGQKNNQEPAPGERREGDQSLLAMLTSLEQDLTRKVDDIRRMIVIATQLERQAAERDNDLNGIQRAVTSVINKIKINETPGSPIGEKSEEVNKHSKFMFRHEQYTDALFITANLKNVKCRSKSGYSGKGSRFFNRVTSTDGWQKFEKSEQLRIYMRSDENGELECGVQLGDKKDGERPTVLDIEKGLVKVKEFDLNGYTSEEKDAKNFLTLVLKYANKEKNIGVLFDGSASGETSPRDTAFAEVKELLALVKGEHA